MSATTQFDESEPNRSDLRMILRAVKQGWPVDPAKRASIVEFCLRSKLLGRFDRLTNLAGEVLTAMDEANAKNAGNRSEQTPVDDKPDDNPIGENAA